MSKVKNYWYSQQKHLNKVAATVKSKAASSAFRARSCTQLLGFAHTVRSISDKFSVTIKHEL